MKWIIAGFAAVAAGLGLAGKAKASEGKIVASNNTDKTPYESLFKKYQALYGVDWRILSGIAFTESSYNPSAVNFADNESIGLMQVLCRPDGSGGCANKFNIDGWREIKKVDLFDPEKNIRIGAQILAYNINTYGIRKGIAVYNEWDQHLASPNGPFKNQSYVNKVLQHAKELGYEIR